MTQHHFEDICCLDVAGSSLRFHRGGEAPLQNPAIKPLLPKQLLSANGSWEIAAPFSLIEIPFLSPPHCKWKGIH